MKRVHVKAHTRKAPPKRGSTSAKRSSTSTKRSSTSTKRSSPKRSPPKGAQGSLWT